MSEPVPVRLSVPAVQFTVIPVAVIEENVGNPGAVGAVVSRVIWEDWVDVLEILVAASFARAAKY
jgi:hypothetical protein